MAATATAASNDDDRTSTTNLLILLHQYSVLHSDASKSFKSALWNITKARRGRGYQSSAGGPLGSSEYSVENVREELDATAVIEVQAIHDVNDVEPELVDDENTDVKNITTDDHCYLLHFDGMEGQRSESVAKADSQIDTINSEILIDENPTNTQEGLRRRRNRGNDSSNNSDLRSQWTEEKHILDESSTEKKSKSYSDPLQLFGVPPPALRVAQSHSRDSLAYYVEVANLAKQIIRIVQKREE